MDTQSFESDPLDRFDNSKAQSSRPAVPRSQTNFEKRKKPNEGDGELGFDSLPSPSRSPFSSSESFSTSFFAFLIAVFQAWLMGIC